MYVILSDSQDTWVQRNDMLMIPLLFLGAIKATNGRGLQPAMDFLLENEGKPVPELSTVSTSSSSQPSGGSGGDVDDEDVEALQAVYGHKGGAEAQVAAAAADVEAKVCTALQPYNQAIECLSRNP